MPSHVTHRARFLGIVLAFLWLGSSVFAADGSGQAAPVPSAGLGALIMWYVCGSRRKQEIGGWLLYYYIQLYLAVIVSLVITTISFDNYRPSVWSAEPTLYPLFLLSTVPGLVISVIQLIVAEKLRKSRDYAWVQSLRRVLWIELAAGALAIPIDYNHFDEDSATFDALALIWPIIWLPYFHFARRVRRVFQTKDWTVPHPVVATAP